LSDFNVCLTLGGNSRGVQRYRSNDDLIFADGETIDAPRVQAKLHRTTPASR